ncbi:MAG: LysE family transporter [Akkermansia sp.]
MNEVILNLLSLGGVLFLAQLSPGPDFLLIFRTSLAQGWRTGAVLGLGISIGFAVQLGIVCTVGTRILEQSWSQYILIAASLYLMYLAWHILPRKRTSDAAQALRAANIEKQKQNSIIQTLAQGFICNILNMKCMLFIAGVTINGLQQYKDLEWYVPALMIWLPLTSAIGWGIWSGLLQWAPLRKAYREHTWVIDLGFALMLFGVSVPLLLSGLGVME